MNPDGPSVGEPRPLEIVHPRYVLHPDWEPAPSRRTLVPGLLLLWLIGLVGSWTAFIFMGAVAEPAGFDSNIDETLDELSLVAQLVLVVVFAPLVEETIYRMPLGRRPALPWLVLSGVITAFFFWIFALGGLFVAVAAGVTWASTSRREEFENWWQRHPGWVVWVAASLFAVTHLINFDIDWSPVAVIAVPLVVAPQLWLGLMFTIARVRYGWGAAVAVHAMHNMTVWLLAQGVS